MGRGKLRKRFIRLRDETRDSFWFVPALLTAGACALAAATLWLDETRASGIGDDVSWLFGGTAAGAWTLLQVIAGSLITVISVAFSVTLIAIQQASAQFSPRLLRNFTSDRANQVVLGTYVATFIYSLLVLKEVRERTETSVAFIPALSLFVAIMLAVVSLGMLIYFIHHITGSLQLPYLLSQIRGELDAEIERQFPETFGPGSAEPPSARALLRGCEEEGSGAPTTVCSREEGYLKRIDEDELRAAAEELGAGARGEGPGDEGPGGAVLEVPVQVGQYVGRGSVLLRAWSNGDVPATVCERIHNAFDLGGYRSVAQDPLFGIEQMADVAVKALSPGINDPTTAIQSLDQIATALRLLQSRQLPSPERRLAHGVRCVFALPTYGDFVEASFGRVRRAARADWGVQLHLLEILDDLASSCPSEDRATALRHQLSELLMASGKSELSTSDRETLRARAAAVFRTLRSTAAARSEAAGSGAAGPERAR